MKKGSLTQFHISGLGALLVMAVFAVSILLVLLTGAKAYAGLTQDGGLRHGYRTAHQYLATRLRQGDGVYTEDFEGVTALVFPEEIDGKTYITRIYCYDGWLRELFTAEKGEFSPADGEKVLEMAQFSAIIEETKITLTFSLPDGSGGQVLCSIPEVTP